MIDSALNFIKDQLNTYLVSQGIDSTTAQVVLSHLVDDAGKYAMQQGSVGVYLFNLEEDRILKEHLPEYKYVNGQHVVREPPLKLNLYVMFAAHMKTYEQAMKVLAAVLTFFQSHSHFAAETHPALDTRIGKLIAEFQSLNFEQLNQIWAFIGAKQLPSLIYKLRLVAIQEDAQHAVQPPLTIINTTIGGR